jgi:hypothetical protein
MSKPFGTTQSAQTMNEPKTSTSVADSEPVPPIRGIALALARRTTIHVATVEAWLSGAPVPPRAATALSSALWIGINAKHASEAGSAKKGRV